MITIDMLNWN